MEKVYGSKGNIVANSKGVLLDLELCGGFGAGAVDTAFYRELILVGGFVLAREFSDKLEDKNIVLDVPCDVGPSLELSLPFRPCSSCESSGAAAEGGDPGSGPATQLHRGESRGQFDDNEEEGPAAPLRDRRWSVLSILGVDIGDPVRRESAEPTGKVAASSEVNLEASEGQSVDELESRGLDAELWDGSRKYVADSSLFKDCPPCMGCNDDQSIEATEKLAGHKKLSVDWRNKVLSVLTGSRLKSRKIVLAEGTVHIKWKDTGDVTSIAPFGNDPLEADIRCAEVKEAVVATKSHTFVLDLCEPVDLKLWKPQAFDTLDSQLQTWCPSHWTLVVFVPREQNLSFLASMNHLSFVKMMEGKWVRKSQQKKSFPVGNNLYTEDGRMYILFKGDDLRANTVYGDMERNPTQFVNLLESVTKKGEGVCFLGKPHARSVWELVKAGRHVIAMEGNSALLQFTIDLVKSEVNSGAHICEFMVVNESRPRTWNNKTDMWFKLSARKRNKIYDFLFLQTRPKRDTDAEYVRRKDLMFTMLDNYHDASRMNAKTFLERLQSLHFVESEEELTFGNYSSLISTEDEETIGIEFDGTANEEGSDTESLDLQYNPHPGQHTTGSSFAGPSTSLASLVSPMAKAAPGTTLMKLLQRMQALAFGHRSLCLGSDITADHLSWKDANIHFLDEPQSRSTEADWGHDMIWHPGVIQPTIQKERTKRTDAQSLSGAGVASYDPKIDSFAVRDGTAPPAGDRQPLRSEREGTCGGPGDRKTAKFIGIRTSLGKGGQPGIVVPAGGAACGKREGHSSEFDTGSGQVAGLHAQERGRVMDKEKEGEEGDTGEELEEGGEEGEEEEDDGEEGEEGEETELAGLLGENGGEKGELDTGDDERTVGDDDDRSG
ncbi:hypothetical protein CBR_g32650 [Chara braunii]|uniref:Uncharacterized protein n=1 Tax=Chara braunii TaxID=69332 RepID=A0A388LH65_CHABU|nr:hypothetical protein CBR_g32650 [Chara braunii]|eukprot:GBG81656.1 hypothetical protein CBR_g32650 [Chara braunii]